MSQLAGQPAATMSTTFATGIGSMSSCESSSPCRGRKVSVGEYVKPTLPEPRTSGVTSPPPATSTPARYCVDALIALTVTHCVGSLRAIRTMLSSICRSIASATAVLKATESSRT